MSPEDTKALADQMQKGIEALNTAQSRDKEIGEKIIGQDEVIKKASDAVADAIQNMQNIELKNKQESDEYHKELDRWKKCHKDFDKKVEELSDTKELLQIARNCQAISLNISNYETQLDLASLALDK